MTSKLRNFELPYKMRKRQKKQDEMMRRNSFMKFFGVKKAKKKQTFQI
jgi:hypothetical protein